MFVVITIMRKWLTVQHVHEVTTQMCEHIDGFISFLTFAFTYVKWFGYLLEFRYGLFFNHAIYTHAWYSTLNVFKCHISYSINYRILLVLLHMNCLK